MKLFIITDVLYGCRWPGMCVIAAENMDQCRELFIEEFGADAVWRWFDRAQFTIIESVGIDEAGVVEYVYGGG